MQILVTFRHLEASEGIRDYVKDKVTRLEKYIPSTSEVHVVLSAEKFRHTAEITIGGNGAALNSQGKNSDLYAAIDLMVDKMERQIRGRRGKARRRRTSKAPSRETLQEGEGLLRVEEEEGPPPILQRRQIPGKPMSLDEAVAQLNLSGEDFLVFVNSDSGQMNVLRRKRGGKYEWTVPSE